VQGVTATTCADADDHFTVVDAHTASGCGNGIEIVEPLLNWITVASLTEHCTPSIVVNESRICWP
jgi:hypothetical protein